MATPSHRIPTRSSFRCVGRVDGRIILRRGTTTQLDGKVESMDSAAAESVLRHHRGALPGDIDARPLQVVVRSAVQPAGGSVRGLCYDAGRGDHAWTKWARNYNCTLLAEEVVQFVSVLVWGLSEGKGDLLHSASWMMFSFIALGRLMHDACIFGLNVAYLLFLDPSDRALTSSGDVFNWPAVPGHVLSCYLFGTGWTLAVIDDVLDKEAYLFWLGVALVWKWCAIISRLHTTSVIGQLLIPIRDVFWEPLILAMLVVLILTVLVVMAFVFIVWKEGSASQIRGAAMNTWINLVIGEPVLLMGEVPNEFDYPWSQYVMISIVHLAITIVLMNVLMAMTMEAYRGMGVKARGRLLRTQAVVCRVTMWKRRVLLTVFCNWLGLNANKALFAIFSFLVVSTAAVLLVTEVRMMIILLMYGGAAEMLLTLFVLLLQTPVKPANATPELKWWIEQNYLWMCTPRREDPRSDSGHAEAPGSARLAGETTPRLEASDDDDDAEIDGDASPRRLLSAQFASTRAESALSYRRNLRGRASDSALEVDTSSQIMVALKMLHDRVEELSRRPGPSQGPGEIV
ncbi:unnamed protein product [Prorocentrum cordatum]|uniref:Ion transport domain-containing protein n=1 Tax=Prorocentrum cordatum TaxID=2364126 RepID=A0ABN9T3G7_9DINO|nr:unnamed protein product [Polarella glacialis]